MIPTPAKPPPEAPPAKPWRLWAAVGGGAAAVMIAAVLLDVASNVKPVSDTAAGTLPFSSPKAFQEQSHLSLPVSESAGADDDGALSFDQVMRRLDELQSDPVAGEFAQEFMKDPALKQIVKDFRDSAKGKAPGSMKDFFQQVGKRPQFRELVSRFRAAPGSKGLLARLGEMPGIRDLLRDDAGAASTAAGPRFASGAGPAGTRSVSAAAPNAGMGADRRSMVAMGVPQLTAGRGSVGIGANYGAESAGGAGAGKDKPPPANGEEDRKTKVKMDEVKAAGPSMTKDSFMSLCIKQSGISHAECEAINENLGPHGIWDSCWMANKYDTCVHLCKTVGELQCASTSPGWVQSCIDASPQEKNRSLSCASDCKAQGRTNCGADAGGGPGPGSAPPTTTTTPPGPPGPHQAAPKTYTIVSGDTMTKIVMRQYGITDPKVAYQTAIELYQYGDNKLASGKHGTDPNFILPGKVITLPTPADLKNKGKIEKY